MFNTVRNCNAYQPWITGKRVVLDILHIAADDNACQLAIVNKTFERGRPDGYNTVGITTLSSEEWAKA